MNRITMRIAAAIGAALCATRPEASRPEPERAPELPTWPAFETFGSLTPRKGFLFAPVDLCSGDRKSWKRAPT